MSITLLHNVSMHQGISEFAFQLQKKKISFHKYPRLYQASLPAGAYQPATFV
jgi:hypothetical protein